MISSQLKVCRIFTEVIRVKDCTTGVCACELVSDETESLDFILREHIGDKKNGGTLPAWCGSKGTLSIREIDRRLIFLKSFVRLRPA